MKKVKITVLRKMFNEDLAKEYGAAGLRPCPMLREYFLCKNTKKDWNSQENLKENGCW